MSAPEIDFARHRPVRRRLLIAALAAALLGCAYSAWRYVDLTRSLDAARKGILQADDASTRARGASAVPGDTPRIDPSRIAAVNGAISRLNIPWSELLAAFELPHANDIALIALSPDAKRRIVVVQAEARTAEAMVAFAENLRSVERFQHSHLVKHEHRAQDPGSPYRFAVEVRWNDPS